jgi:hypothetical protein
VEYGGPSQEDVKPKDNVADQENINDILPSNAREKGQEGVHALSIRYAESQYTENRSFLIGDFHTPRPFVSLSQLDPAHR